MAELKQLEFFLLRYVPNAVREEFVNVGLLLHDVDGGFSAVRMTEDWSSLRSIDPEADLEVLAGLGAQLERELQETELGWEGVLRKVQDSFSNQLQASRTKAYLAKDFATGLAALSNLYFSGRAAASRSVASGRQVILRKMENEFRSAGVLDLLQKGIRVAEYTKKKGDPQSFDFGYPHGDEVKFLHAVSLKSDLRLASGLASSFRDIAQDIYDAHHAEAKLTVVVDDDLDRGLAGIGYVISKMETNRIRVAEAREMAGIAMEVRAELRA